MSCVALSLSVASVLNACTGKDTISGPSVRALLAEQPCVCDDGAGGGGQGTYDTSQIYGSYQHFYQIPLYGTDADIDSRQQAAYNYDHTAFAENSRDWSNPEAVAVMNWPAAAVAAGAVGVRAAVAAGRAFARTPQIRLAVAQGARYARDAAVAVAAHMMAGRFPLAAGQDVNSIPVAEFDFIFDYATP